MFSSTNSLRISVFRYVEHFERLPLLIDCSLLQTLQPFGVGFQFDASSPSQSWHCSDCATARSVNSRHEAAGTMRHEVIGGLL